nr:DNA internalization-related competence protein ComEC/Rec2 [Halalkalibacter urbisdiaboli]
MFNYGPYLVVSAILGISFSIRGPSIPFFLAFFCLLLISLLNRIHYRTILLIIFCTFSFYFVIGCLTEFYNQTSLNEGEQNIAGTIVSIPKIDGDSFSAKFITRTGEYVQVHSFIETQKDQELLRALEPGAFCNIKGSLQSPTPPTNFYQFDYERYLYEQKIHWILTPQTSSFPCVTHKTNVYSLEQWRKQQLERLDERVDNTLSGLMNALLFGERGYIEQEVLHAYQQLGVIHLLAISGLHVGMIVAASYYVCIRIGLTRERAMDVLIILLPLYAMITGGSPSVIRAVSMSIVVLICLRFRLSISPLTGIYTVFLVYVAISPYALFQLGFQLSFLISFGLLVSSAKIQKCYTTPFVKLVAVTFIAQILSFPLLLFHFYEWSLVSLPLNLIYIPFISLLILPLCFLSLMFSFFAEFNPPLWVLSNIIPIVHKGLLLIEHKSSSIVLGKPSLIQMIGYYLAIGWGFFCWESGKKGWWIKGSSIFLVVLFMQCITPYFQQQAIITMLDVGQGDSFVIELPHRRHVYIIDTGGIVRFEEDKWRQKKNRFEVGEDVVLPYLKARGIRKVDKLILTHGHYDHIGGASALVDEVEVKQILYATGAVEGEVEKALLKSFYLTGTDISFVRKGDSWTVGNNHFAILAPQGQEQGLNNRSIVVFAEIEGINWLFTGDLEEEGEKKLMLNYPSLKVDVLKAGHHGSRTSSNDWFIDSLEPQLTLISAGRNNRFGHPHPEVIHELEERGIVILRTDKVGAVQLKLKKKRLKIYSTK